MIKLSSLALGKHIRLPQRFSGVVCAILLLISARINAQDPYDVMHHWMKFTDAANLLYKDLAHQAYRQLEKRDRLVSGLHTLTDWQQRQQWARQVLGDLVGPFPKKTPLNARVTRTIKQADYRIEDIVYESQPGFYVTASLFIPEGLQAPGPAIIYVSGHSATGYRDPVYQHVVLNLVKKGFIVFAFDPIGQGERLQYYDEQTKKSTVGGPTHEHSYPGMQAFITGSTLARYMIWDGIRAVDYLLGRKEVDPARIGITGRSGGGTQTAYIAAFDQRIYAAAPENYITNFTRLIQAIGPQDAEQNLPDEIASGIDHADFLTVRAPKPTLMITTTRDMFPIQGARETAQEVSRIFKAYGKSAAFRRVEDDTVHASSKKNREAMYAFFQKYLALPGDSSDLDVAPLDQGELQVTRTGQVATSLGGETIYSLNRKEAAIRLDALEESRQHMPEHLSRVVRSAKERSGYQEPVEAHAPVFTGRFQKQGYVVEQYFVQGDDAGDVIPYLLMVPEVPNGKAVICLDPDGKSIAAKPGGDMEWFVRKGYTVLAPDLIGMGETGRGDFKGDSFFSNTSYGVWYLSMLIGRSLAGIRAGEVNRLARLLKRNHSIDAVYGLTRKQMAPVLLHAAAFDTAISRVLLLAPCASYRSIVMDRFYRPACIEGAVPGALMAYDLPDLAAALAPRKLLMVNRMDASGRFIDPETDSIDLRIVQKAYHDKNADGQLTVGHSDPEEKPYAVFEEWIKEE